MHRCHEQRENLRKGMILTQFQQLLLSNKHSPSVRPGVNHGASEAQLIKEAHSLVHGLLLILFLSDYQITCKRLGDSEHCAQNTLSLPPQNLMALSALLTAPF